MNKFFQGCCITFFSFLTMLTIHSSSSFGKSSIDSTEKLGLLQTATGSGTGASTGSFQDRLNGILNQDATADRSLVAREDEEARQAALQAEIQEQALPSFASPSPSQPFELTQNQGEESRIKPEPYQNKIMADEKSFQADRQKILDKTPENNEEPVQASRIMKEQAPTKKSKLPPSLANNPFYFGPVEEKNFDDDKPLIISRIIQSTNGQMTELEARNLVQNASTPEEVILALMQDEDFDYGEAVAIVKTE